MNGIKDDRHIGGCCPLPLCVRRHLMEDGMTHFAWLSHSTCSISSPSLPDGDGSTLQHAFLVNMQYKTKIPMLIKTCLHAWIASLSPLISISQVKTFTAVRSSWTHPIVRTHRDIRLGVSPPSLAQLSPISLSFHLIN